MSMLADPKRKQKWTILDRNVNKSNSWSKDSNKFGQKMLERMGWKEGKGLGRNEDGLKDYVKVPYKNNSKGVGFKDSVEWSAQQDNFNALLGELSNSNDDAKQEIKSLEEKSQNSRARVHYRKFTRGKDLSRYSEKDLANIFGKKKLGGAPEANADVGEEMSTSNGGQMISGGSMVDYFRSKMSSNRAKVEDDLNNLEEFGLNGSCEDDKRSKKSKNKTKNTFVSYVGEEEEDKVSSKKRKGEDSNEIQDSTPSKKLKLGSSELGKKSKIKNESNLGLANPAFEPLGSNITVKKHVLDTIVESDDLNESEVVANEDSFKIKKKKAKTNRELDPELKDVEELKPKKNKKPKSALVAVDNPAFNESCEEDEVKRKKKKIKSLDNNSEETNLESSSTTQNFEVKRKKKKSKGLDNPALNFDDSNSDPQHVKENSELESTPNYEVKRKKKKSKGLDNPALSESVLSLTDSQDNQTQNKNGIVNTALQVSDSDIMLNVTDEPAKTSKPSKNKPKNVRFSRTNQEYPISSRSPGDIDKRNELYDINTKVIQDGLRDLKKQKNSAPANHNFDIKSVDKIDFCDDGSSKSPRTSFRRGIDNRAFDAKAQNVEESVNLLTQNIDRYQAEVENGMNEFKMRRTTRRGDFMVGEFNCSDGENEEHEEGVKLRFKHAQFSTKEPVWAKRNNDSACFAKKSYKHLIRGDIIVGFKKSNLHKIEGYATSTPK